jgi:type III pantothenate kinase
LTKLSPLIVEPGLKTGLNIKIDNPAELGADLVCGAVAAKSMFPSPCVAIDLGTVTKVMALDSDGALIGGVLAPGVGVGCKMMSESTALLPLVGFGASKVPDPPIIGTNTVDCIKGGVLFGTACMLDGLITRFERQIGSKCSIVATGGFAEIIVPHCEHKVEVCQSLVSQGLRIIYNKNALHS